LNSMVSKDRWQPAKWIRQDFDCLVTPDDCRILPVIQIRCCYGLPRRLPDRQCRKKRSNNKSRDLNSITKGRHRSRAAGIDVSRDLMITSIPTSIYSNDAAATRAFASRVPALTAPRLRPCRTASRGLHSAGRARLEAVVRKTAEVRIKNGELLTVGGK